VATLCADMNRVYPVCMPARLRDIVSTRRDSLEMKSEAKELLVADKFRLRYLGQSVS
jgi:hypothetical protein